MEAEAQNVYYSINKFVEFIVEKTKKKVKEAILYFENEDVYKNQFEHACIKPLFIQLKTDKEKVYLNHKKILEMCDGQLTISFSENANRKLPKDKDALCEMIITFEEKTFKDFKYYPASILICANEKNKEAIRGQVQKVKHEEDLIPINCL